MPSEPTDGRPEPQPSLWRHANFVRVWLAQSLSQFGAEISAIALPLLAVLTLEASGSDLGTMRALQRLPFLLLSLFAGVLIDRLRRRPALVAADLGRAALLAAVPALAVAGYLRMEVLYLLAFLVGCCTVVFQLAHQSFLPDIVGRAQLLQANSRVDAVRSLAHIVGPGIGGALVQAVTAPLALGANALCFLASAGIVSRVRHDEVVKPRRGRRILADAREGLRFTLASPALRTIALTAAVFNVGYSGFQTVFLLFMPRQLGISPAFIGLIVAAAGPGLLLGSMLAARAARRFGVGPTLVIGSFVAEVPLLLAALANAATIPTIAALGVIQFLYGLGFQLFSVNALSLRQGITPADMQGRVAATTRLLGAGMMPLGALVAGFLSDATNPRVALAVSAAVALGAGLIVTLSSLRRVRSVEDALPAGRPAE